MRVLILSITILASMVSCDTDSSQDSISDPIEVTNPNQIVEAIIDDSDLSLLPKDEGGRQKAHPLGSTSASFGFNLYLPSNYSEDGPEYPLIVFLHGWGGQGDSSLNPSDLDRITHQGPPGMIRSGIWNPTYPFIVVSPQAHPEEYWYPEEVHDFINYLLETYQINARRIYLTGLSMGGGGCWYYVGEIEDNHAAAIVPIAAYGAPSLVDNLKRIPVWAFHGADDSTVLAYDWYGSVPMVEMINASGPVVPAKVTVFPETGHNSWTKTYHGTGMFKGDFRLDQYNMNIYDWMLQYRKNDF
jgi:predicted peptidase